MADTLPMDRPFQAVLDRHQRYKAARLNEASPRLQKSPGGLAEFFRPRGSPPLLPQKAQDGGSHLPTGIFATYILQILQ
jgi:hypothetical protein